MPKEIRGKKDVRGGKVEKWRIPPEMREWLQRYKGIKRVEGYLREATAVEKARFDSLQEMWNALQAETAKLEYGQPGEPVRELEGMEFPPEEEERPMDFQIRY